MIDQLEASLMLGCSIRTIERLRQKGILRTVRIGRMVRLYKQDVQEYIWQQSQLGLSKQSRASGMFTMRKMDVRKERAFGRKLSQSRNSASADGLKIE